MGYDLLTTKCDAHNYVMPYRSSCPICVSAKRSQLHAANLAHMPRYLFEQQLDVKATPQGTPKLTPYDVRLIVDDVAVTTPKYVLNFVSNYSADLNATTCALLRKLDKYEDGLGALRMKHQKIIEGFEKPLSSYMLAVKGMAKALWVSVASRGAACNSMKVRDQFLAEVEYSWAIGQRLTDIQAPVPVTVPTKYSLNRRSQNWNGHDALLKETKDVFRILELGIPEIYERWFNLLGCVALSNITVKSMACTLWDTVVEKQYGMHELKGDMKVRQDFVERFTYLYDMSQRIFVLPSK